MGTAEAEVIIVGGGPVGMGLAIELAQRGIRSVILERHFVPQPIPKGQNLTQRTMEHFRTWGVEEAIRKASPIPVSFGIGGLTAYGTLLSPFHYDWYQRVIVRPFYLCDNERLPQYETEAALRRRAAELPQITTVFGWTAQTISQTQEGVEVVALSRDGERRTWRAQCLVGCDGARSLVREEAGMTQTRSDHDIRMVLLVFSSSDLNKLIAHYKGKSFFNVLHPELDGYWRFFGRVDTGEKWFFHAPVPAGTTEDNFDFHAYLESVVGAPFECSFEHIGFWDLRIAVADDYRKGRIFIGGDAAHSHPPYGGYGINTGLEDVRNLGWKLAAELQGWAGKNLLASYSAERQPVFVSTARDFIQSFIDSDRAFLRAHDPAKDLEDFKTAWALRAAQVGEEIRSFEPNYEGSPLVFGPQDAVPSAVGEHEFAARAGHHLAPQPLSNGKVIFDELGAGFTLLALDADEAVVADFEAEAKAMNIPLKVIRDHYTDERQAYAARLVLIRPDDFVAYAGNEGVKAAEILKRAIGA
jgi:2-polyprenyl-6-methoxyphenol hydroxylase-like FAD-dependent oxidoreductase